MTIVSNSSAPAYAGKRNVVTVAPVGEVATVDVMVDGSGRLGRLAYQVPPGDSLQCGDAVSVPFGQAVRTGIVLGESCNPDLATREVIAYLGSRCDPVDMQVCVALAAEHGVSLESLLPRVSPSRHKGSRPLSPGRVALELPRTAWPKPEPARNWLNRLYLRSPLVNPAQLAAWEAARLADRYDGQVLVLAPTVELVSAVLQCFASGAVRLDSHALPGHWAGFREGTARIGVGTRSAALYSASKLAGIVVVEEDHPGHLESSTPYTHARDVAARRAGAHNCALTLISASPTPQGIGSRVKVVPVGPSRAWPTVTVVDQLALAPSERAMPPAVRAMAERAVRSGKPVIAVASARASQVVCANCGELAGESVGRANFVCAQCSGQKVRRSGVDRAAVQQLLPSADVRTLAQLVPASQPSLVIVPTIDSLAFSRSLLPEHDMASALVRAAEAAGPSGRVVVLTRNPSDPVVQFAARGNSEGMARLVWHLAKERSLPPFGIRISCRVGTPACPRTSQWPGRVFGPRKVDQEWVFEVLASTADRECVLECVRKLRNRGKARVLIEG